MKYFSYSHLLKQRAVLVGLTLGLTAVFLGLMLELVVSSQKTTIPPAVQRLIVPLNPQLDVKTVEKIESYPPVTLEEARRELSRKRVVSPPPVLENAFSSSQIASDSGQASPAPDVLIPSSEPEL